jgi:microcystin-dependent protein
MDFYLASIFLFGGNFNFRGTQMCNGQILAISSNTALFSLIGTYYGGNGQSTFGLPDLRGRAALSMGQGPGLSLYDIGEQTGVANTTLLANNIPLHNHLVNAVVGLGETSTGTPSPSNALIAQGGKVGGGPTAKAPDYFISATAPNTNLNSLAIGPNIGGGSNPFSIMQPYLAVTYLIATSGVFPARN